MVRPAGYSFMGMMGECLRLRSERMFVEMEFHCGDVIWNCLDQVVIVLGTEMFVGFTVIGVNRSGNDIMEIYTNNWQLGWHLIFILLGELWKTGLHMIVQWYGCQNLVLFCDSSRAVCVNR